MKKHSKHLSVFIILILCIFVGVGYYFFLLHEDRRDGSYGQATSYDGEFEIVAPQVATGNGSEMLDRLLQPSIPMSEEAKTEAAARLLENDTNSNDNIN